MDGRAVQHLNAEIRSRLQLSQLQAVTAAAIVVHKAAIDVLASGSPGRGHEYNSRGSKGGKGGARVKHRASAPGDPPATDTGRLRKSIAWSIEKGGPVSARVGSTVNYAKYLDPAAQESSPAGKGVVLPRPFLSRALNSSRDQVRRVIAEQLEKGMKGL